MLHGRYGQGYFRKAHRKVPKFPEGKEKKLLLINMADTSEIEYTLVPNTKGKSDLWKHFNLRKRKTDSRIDADVAIFKPLCNSVVKRVGGTSNMSRHRKRHHHPLSLLWITCGEQTEGLHACPHQSVYRYVILLYRYEHKIPV